MAENTVTPPLHHLTNDLTGKVIGMLTVLAPLPERYNRYVMWSCRCSCGNTVNYGSIRLANGVQNCGCVRRAKRERMKLPEYGIWKGMVARCASPHLWPRYAGRGITVCDRWRSFENFYADMGPRPSMSHSIDRIDNDGHYEPENCRWATQCQQTRNFVRNRILTHEGVSAPLIEWSERTGISAISLSHRLSRGWSVTRALTTPTQQRRK